VELRISRLHLAIIIAIIVLVLLSYFIFFKARRVPEPFSPGTYIFEDTYEGNPVIKVMTQNEWMQMSSDSIKGNYWRDSERWLEKGWIEEGGRYMFDARPSTAIVVSGVAHSGSKSTEITIPEAPPGYVMTGRALARYVRNQSLVREGRYEVGAWLYIPEESYPIIYLSMEDHPSWIEFYIVNVALDTKDGSIGFYNEDYAKGPTTIGKIDFQHETWFKLWISYNTNEKRYTIGYKSLAEEKTFEVNKLWTGRFNLVFIGYAAFNFYVGGNNLSGENEQKLYIDDFYAKALGET